MLNTKHVQKLENTCNPNEIFSPLWPQLLLLKYKIANAKVLKFSVWNLLKNMVWLAETTTHIFYITHSIISLQLIFTFYQS